MSTARLNDDAAHYVHGGLYRYDKNAVKEVYRRFQNESKAQGISGAGISFHYDYNNDLFILKCPRDVGPPLDESVRNILLTANAAAGAQASNNTNEFANVKRYKESLPAALRALQPEDEHEPHQDDADTTEHPLPLVTAHHLVMLASNASRKEKSTAKITLASTDDLLRGPLRRVMQRSKQPLAGRVWATDYHIRQVRFDEEADTLVQVLCEGPPPTVYPEVEDVIIRIAQSTDWRFNHNQNEGLTQRAPQGQVNEWLSHIEQPQRIDTSMLPEVSALDLAAQLGYTQVRHADAESDSDASDQSFHSAVNLRSLLACAGDAGQREPQPATARSTSPETVLDSDTDEAIDLAVMLGRPSRTPAQLPVQAENITTASSSHQQRHSQQQEQPETIQRTRTSTRTDKFGLMGHADIHATWTNAGTSVAPTVVDSNTWESSHVPSAYRTPINYLQTVLGGAEAWARRRVPDQYAAPVGQLVDIESRADWPDALNTTRQATPVAALTLRKKWQTSTSAATSTQHATQRASTPAAGPSQTERPPTRARSMAISEGSDGDLIDLHATEDGIVERLRALSPRPKTYKTMRQQAGKKHKKKKASGQAGQAKEQTSESTVPTLTTKAPSGILPSVAGPSQSAAPTSTMEYPSLVPPPLSIPARPAAIRPDIPTVKQESNDVGAVPQKSNAKSGIPHSSGIDNCLALFQDATTKGLSRLRITFGRAVIGIDEKDSSIPPAVLLPEAMTAMLNEHQHSTAFTRLRPSMRDAMAALGIEFTQADQPEAIVEAAHNIQSLLVLSAQWHNDDLIDIELDLETKELTLLPHGRWQQALHVHMADAAVDADIQLHSLETDYTGKERTAIHDLFANMRLESTDTGALCVLDLAPHNLRVLTVKHITRSSRPVKWSSEIDARWRVELVKEFTIRSDGRMIVATGDSLEQMKSNNKLYWQTTIAIDRLEATQRSVESLMALLRHVALHLTGILLPGVAVVGDVGAKPKPTPFW